MRQKNSKLQEMLLEKQNYRKLVNVEIRQSSKRKKTQKETKTLEKLNIKGRPRK